MYSNIQRNNSNNITPDQSDHRGHVVYDRSARHKKEKTVRQIRPEDIYSGRDTTKQIRSVIF